MAVDLTKPLRWLSADADSQEMLSDLQSNILKGHGRKATRILFLKFLDQIKALLFFKSLEPLVMPAIDQLRQAEIFKSTQKSGDPVMCVGLSASGYTFLGAAAKAPSVQDGGAFQAGMKSRQATLGDPVATEWQAEYRVEFHAILLIAGDPDAGDSWTSTVVDNLETQVLNMMSQAAEVVASEAGRAIFNGNGDGLENFGYVDGRSQPLMLAEDIDQEQKTSGINLWDPSFPLAQVLVKDLGAIGENSFGSFLVFRKLEQNVSAFKSSEDALGKTLENGELAGATIVGRYEDGTPIELLGVDGLNHPVTNNFNYDADPNGIRCPMHAHIRKTNPRGESAVKLKEFGVTVEAERAHIMARRAMPYGRRNSIVDPTDAPTDGVGLLFMAHQSNLHNQFEFTQSTWVNNEDFVEKGVGIDPVIGQGTPSNLTHFSKWDDPNSRTQMAPFGGFVTLKGGEYFFMPAKSTLRNLGA